MEIYAATTSGTPGTWIFVLTVTMNESKKRMPTRKLMRQKYYALEGKTVIPVPGDDVTKWALGFERKSRHVAETELDGARISTVFLGLDHNYLPDGPPLIFETMIFGGEHDGYEDRYSTWDEAEAGHAKAIKIASGQESKDE